MSLEALIPIITLACSALGVFGGMIISSRLNTYRLEQLEKIVAQCSDLSKNVLILEERIKNIYDAIDALKSDNRYENDVLQSFVTEACSLPSSKD